MIKYNLECICGKMFESWFSGSKEYDLLKKKELINCIYCNSTSVKKTLMTPNLTGKANKISKEDKRERKLRKQLVEFRKYIEKNCKDVGDKFSQEARNIHYDKKTNKTTVSLNEPLKGRPILWPNILHPGDLLPESLQETDGNCVLHSLSAFLNLGVRRKII